MHGLPQARLLSNQLLERCLGKSWYYQSTLVPGLWKHKTRPIQLTLVIDNFGVKYTRKEDANHLIAAIKVSKYRVKDNWTGGKDIGIILNWDYEQQQVHLSMPEHVEKALQRFRHERPSK